MPAGEQRLSAVGHLRGAVGVPERRGGRALAAQSDLSRAPAPARVPWPAHGDPARAGVLRPFAPPYLDLAALAGHARFCRSEEHTSELQSRENLVCCLLLE